MTDHLTDGPDGGRASGLLHGVTADLAPDVDRLVQGGVARGRTIRRRRRVGTSLAAVAVVGVLGIAASAGSGLFGGDESTAPQVGYAGTTAADPSPTQTPTPVPTTASDDGSLPAGATTTLPIDTTLAVAAEDVPATIGELVPGGSVGEILRGPGFGVADEEQRTIVHFLYDGTLTTFTIEPADSLATCAAMIDPADQADGQPGGECVERDGAVLLTWGPDTADGVVGQGVMAWLHGYVVSALSYNAADGKDVAPVTADPPISMDDLAGIVTSEVWFGG